jgi:hypothetical protein
MRIRSFTTLSTLALLAAASAYGQQALRVDIPFEFTVARTVMPAGHCDGIGAPQGSGAVKTKTGRDTARANPDVARVTVPVRAGSVTLASLR